MLPSRWMRRSEAKLLSAPGESHHSSTQCICLSVYRDALHEMRDELPFRYTHKFSTIS